MNWNSFRFIDLFAGIGGIRLGFEDVGGHCVFSSEFDEDACKTYEANFGEHPSGDITKIDSKDIPDFDILLGGFPCQAFSIIGKKEGFANETCGTLFFDIERILKDKRPPAFMLENVRNLTAHDGGNTFRVIKTHLEALGYHVYAKVLNALDFGVPQKRERIIIVGFIDNVDFAFPRPIDESKHKTLSDILEKTVDKKYYVRDEIRESRLERLKDKDYPKPYISHENIAGTITPHPYSSALRAGASANYILINDERRPTERELLRIQGFPESFKIVLPYGKIKKQTGNSVAVPMIKAVAEEMIKSLKAYADKEVIDMDRRPRLRDSGRLTTETLYPLNVFPTELINKIGGYLVYLIYIGRKDVSGNDWGDAFADAISGTHLDSPVGIADVVKDRNCWSMKTVKVNDPFAATSIRLISGRCSPDYSYGITDPHQDVQRTGEAVLNIWNERINIATDHYSRVRTAILVRSYDLLSYRLFEEETQRFRTTDYHWEVNSNGNLIGLDHNNKVCFTWQPHGSQFTIHTEVPAEAIKFQIRRPPMLQKNDVLQSINFDESWITIIE